MSATGVDQQKTLEEQILQYLQDQGGTAAIGDKSPPDEIYKLFQSSKKNFKRALGNLYKKRKIIIGRGETSLADAE